jgi:hypothetical protein
VLVGVDQVLEELRSGFFGKASPLHFFRGSFDMAVTRLPAAGVVAFGHAWRRRSCVRERCLQSH